MKNNIFKCVLCIVVGILSTRITLNIMTAFSIEIYNNVSLLGGGGLQEFSSHLSFVTHAMLVQAFKFVVVLLYVLGMLNLSTAFAKNAKELIDRLNKKC